MFRDDIHSHMHMWYYYDSFQGPPRDPLVLAEVLRDERPTRVMPEKRGPNREGVLASNRLEYITCLGPDQG
jgi:hypothetical protein